MSELLFCPVCGVDYDVYYSFANNEEIVSQTHCKCIKKPTLINGKKPLDYALEVLNEKFGCIPYKVSKRSSGNSQKQT